MNIWIFILVVVVLVLVLILVFRKPRTALRQTQGKIVGICKTAIGLDTKKQERKEKILTLLRERDSLSNSDIREAFEISERSVVRYMNELEREGRVEQVGKTGRSVAYRIKS